ncbi:MAG TPA: 2-oxoacid:acceptor oxidoreductase subunit alpha, partial [Thermoanaerobaculia bacterium]|nr:2-oxoacid:acceptor oxidoreductase subunit alpha [Thermoanaerobaculia bacterium]
MSTTVSENEKREIALEKLDEVVIRFAGDSGDGMQLTGSQFTTTSALFGNDLSTLPDFPAEIRAPAGTLPGVSAFQVRIADHDIHTPGDAPDVLVAMNPAALKKELKDLKPNGVIIVNTDEFNERNFAKANIKSNPLEDGSLEGFRVFAADLSTMTRRALEGTGLDAKSMDRCKNMFALGMCYWLFSRPLDSTITFLERQFAKKPHLAEANIRVLKAGWNYCDITEVFHQRWEVAAAPLEPGMYRNITGNVSLALGLIAASRRSGLQLFLGAYPITPASDVLHELARYKNFGVTTFQAEDEIAAVCAAIGASFGGALGVTASSGPGIALKAEAMNLAVMTELPLIVCDIQRGGPSTGLPTKTEQADLLQVMFGRNSESPMPILAPATPKDCFEVAVEAVRIATRYMTPVAILSDGYIANGSEPWKLPQAEDLPDLRTEFRTDPAGFAPYVRDPETLARPWAIPGTPGLEHRIGGLEKEDG